MRLIRDIIKWWKSPTEFRLLPADTDRGDALAERLGTEIPPAIDMRIWTLPLLEAITERLERLEKKDENDKVGGDSPR